jgi:putative oxidoreductase
MLVAYIAADREALKSFVSEPGKFYAADPYTFLFAALLVMVLGPGVFSLDYVVARYVEKCHGPNPVPAPATVSQKL